MVAAVLQHVSSCVPYCLTFPKQCRMLLKVRWPRGSPAAGWSAGGICASAWGSVLGAHSRQHSPVARGRAPLGGGGRPSGTRVHTRAGQQRSAFTVRPSGGAKCSGFPPPRPSSNSGSSPGRCGKGCLWPGQAVTARLHRGWWSCGARVRRRCACWPSWSLSRSAGTRRTSS